MPSTTWSDFWSYIVFWIAASSIVPIRYAQESTLICFCCAVLTCTASSTLVISFIAIHECMLSEALVSINVIISSVMHITVVRFASIACYLQFCSWCFYFRSSSFCQFGDLLKNPPSVDPENESLAERGSSQGIQDCSCDRVCSARNWLCETVAADSAEPRAKNPVKP